MHHHADRPLTDLNRREPHRDTGDGTKHKAHQHLEVAMTKGSRQAAAAPHVQPLHAAQQHASADGELGEKDMKDAEPPDHHTLHQRTEINNRVALEWIHESSQINQNSGGGPLAGSYAATDNPPP